MSVKVVVSVSRHRAELVGVKEMYSWVSSRWVIICLKMVALTIERYLEIVHPIKHRLKMTKVKVIIVLVVIDIVGLGFKSSFIISTNTVRNGGCASVGYPNTATKKAVGATNFFVEYLGPIVVIAFCYIRMAMSLKTSVAGGGGGSDVSDASTGSLVPTQNPRMIRAKNNIIKTLFVSIVVFLTCMSFKEFLLVLQFFDVIVLNFDSWCFQVSNAMIYCTCIMDPIVYFTNYEEFQKGIFKLFCL